jgi:adenylosuccinate synthase
MDLIDSKRLKQKVGNEWKLKKLRVTKAYGAKFDADLTKTISDYTRMGKIIKPYVADVSQYIRNNIEKENILMESAQGAYLDFAFGSYPYTVAYHTIAPAAMADIGMPARNIEVMGIVKAYTTRVGNGPFLAEQDNKVGQHLRDNGHEYGTVSGRPRRCGWLDLPMIKQAIEINGVTKLALTKLDVLSGLGQIQVVTHYLKNGKKLMIPPADDFEAGGMKPVYRSFSGWQTDLTRSNKLNDLPAEVKAYLRFIESWLNVPLDYISVGPDRKQTIIRN